jgi:hypothetical protein
MAKVVRDGDQITLQLSFWEKLGALHTCPTAKVGAISGIEIVEKLWGSHTLRGIRAPGTALPYLVLLGTLRGKGYKDFVAMKGRGPGAVITFTDGPFERWIFTLRQPEGELAALLAKP